MECAAQGDCDARRTGLWTHRSGARMECAAQGDCDNPNLVTDRQKRKTVPEWSAPLKAIATFLNSVRTLFNRFRPNGVRRSRRLRPSIVSPNSTSWGSCPNGVRRSRRLRQYVACIVHAPHSKPEWSAPLKAIATHLLHGLVGEYREGLSEWSAPLKAIATVHPSSGCDRSRRGRPNGVRHSRRSRDGAKGLFALRAPRSLRAFA